MKTAITNLLHKDQLINYLKKQNFVGNDYFNKNETLLNCLIYFRITWNQVDASRHL